MQYPSNNKVSAQRNDFAKHKEKNPSSGAQRRRMEWRGVDITFAVDMWDMGRGAMSGVGRLGSRARSWDLYNFLLVLFSFQKK